MNKTFCDQKILVLGLGKSGLSMANLLQKKGAVVLGYDDHPINFRTNFPVATQSEALDIHLFNGLALSPGVALSHPLVEKARQKGIPIFGEVEIGARLIRNYCIAVTGTNGKSTVTSLIAHLLNTAGIRARAVGNIGIPLTSVVENIDPQEILVVELSSYQIDSLQTPFIDQALILNITPDHLDRYSSMQAYAHSKLRIQQLIKPQGLMWISKEIHQTWASSIFFDRLKHFDALALSSMIEGSNISEKGFNASLITKNVQAALAAVQHFKIEKAVCQKGLFSFQGLAHRMEKVGEVKGVVFYNDSKATNVESVVQAVCSISNPLILIMGGQDKGLDFEILKGIFSNRVKAIYLIGQCRDKMAKVFEKEYPIHLCSSLKEAILQAFEISQKFDAILLSPAASSVDMFDNFEHRGDEFKRIVQELIGDRS